MYFSSMSNDSNNKDLDSNLSHEVMSKIVFECSRNDKAAWNAYLRGLDKKGFKLKDLIINTMNDLAKDYR